MSVRLVAVALLAMGCAAARSTYHLTKAQQQLDLAQEAGAEELAPFEWVLAQQHKIKAEEEWGYSQFETAETLAATSVEWSNKAAEQAQQRAGAKVLEVMPEDVPEEVVAPVQAVEEPDYIPEDDLLDEELLEELESLDEDESPLGPAEPWSDE